MDPVFKKLQFKAHDKIYVLNAPKELKSHLDEIAKQTTVKRSPVCKQKYDFALFFIKSCADIEKYAPKAAAKMNDDGVLWFAYPKKSSKRYETDLSRDDGWQPLGDLGYEGVRQVAVDEDWSAIRFRHVDHIKSMSRDKKRAMSKKGKTRAR